MGETMSFPLADKVVRAKLVEPCSTTRRASGRMSEARFESPLAGLNAPLDRSISITEIVDQGMIDLRGDPRDKAFESAAESVLGDSLPRQPRSSIAAGELSVLWLSVDQWLVLCPRAPKRPIWRTG
jgi:sarcosine oxidase gamma subunit